MLSLALKTFYVANYFVKWFSKIHCPPENFDSSHPSSFALPLNHSCTLGVTFYIFSSSGWA